MIFGGIHKYWYCEVRFTFDSPADTEAGRQPYLPYWNFWWKDFWNNSEILKFCVFSYFQIFPSPEISECRRTAWRQILLRENFLRKDSKRLASWDCSSDEAFSFFNFSNLRSFVQSTHCFVQLTVKHLFHKLSLTVCLFWPEARRWPLPDSRNEIMAGCRKHFAEELRG